MNLPKYLPALSSALLTASADAVLVTLTSGDSAGDSSFNSVGNWNPAIAPSSGNDYLVDNGALRTPFGMGGTMNFEGDSLTVVTQFSFKSNDNSVINVDNLILDTGFVRNNEGTTTQTLSGGLTLAAGGGSLRSGGNATSARTLIVTSTVSGAGTLNLQAFDDMASFLELSSVGTNTYSGGTTVTEGDVRVTVNGGFGSGNVSVSGGALLQLVGVTNSINDSASLSIDASVVDLDFIGTDIIGDLSLDGGTTFLGAGVYGAATDPTFFTGTGTLTVIPEPGSLFLLGGGLLLAFTRRRS